MRRLFIIVISLFAVAVLGLLAFVFLFDMDRFRPQIEAQMAKSLNRGVKMSKLGLRVFPFSIRMEDFTVAEASGYPQTAPFASAKQVFANASLLSLFRGSPEIESLQLEQPRVQLIRNLEGNWNFSTLGNGTRKSNGDSSFSLGEFTMNDGQVSLVDLRVSPAPSVYDHIDLQLKDFGPGKQFPVTISAHLPGNDKASMAFKANAGPINESSLVLTPVDGQLSMQNVSLAELGGKKSGVEGSATGNVAIKLDRGMLTSSGKVGLQNVKMQGIAMGFPIQADFNITGDLQKELFHLQPLNLQLDKTPLQVNGILDAARTPANVSLQVTTANSSIAELAKLAGAFGSSVGIDASGKASLNVKVAGPVNAVNYSGSAAVSNAVLKPDTLTKPLEVHSATVGFEHSVNAGVARDGASVQNLSLTVGATNLRGNVSVQNFNAPNLSFTLNADKIDVGELQALSKTPASSQPNTAAEVHRTPDHRWIESVTGSGVLDAATIVTSGLVLTKVHSGVSFERGVIRLSPLAAGLFGGEETGTVTADLRAANPAFTVQANLTGIDANRLLTAVSAAKDTLQGNLAAKTNLQFTIPPDGDLIKSLNGSLGFNLTGGHLKNLDLINELGKIAKFTGAPPPSGNTTQIKRLSGDLVFTNGLANTSDLKAEIAQGTISSAGTINLVNQALNMRLTAVLFSNFSKALGGQAVGGFLQTALANRKGELVIPATVRGTTSKPIIEPDVAAIAKMQLTNLLPTSGNPAELTSGLLGALTGGKGAGGSKTQGLLDALTGQGQAGKGQAGRDQQGNAGGIIGGLLNGLGKKKPDQKK